MDLKEEEALGSAIDQHWYYQSKARVLAAHLDTKADHVLDVGAGSGWFSRWLLENGLAGRATLVDPGYATERQEGPLRYVRSIESSDADIVLMMDVLEHVDVDVDLIASYLG
jgi:2-polyprenyl-3-methyl-5-hydroxy-6-metoxy-1,4-benzoquinol methylase